MIKLKILNEEDLHRIHEAALDILESTGVWFNDSSEAIELFKQAYKREARPFAFFYRLFGFKKKVTIDQLEEWQHLLVLGSAAVLISSQ